MAVDHFQSLRELAKGLPPVPAAIIHPCDLISLRGALDAATLGLIEPILVGPAHKIKAVAKEHNLDLRDYPIESTPHSHASASRGVELVHEGKARMMMKGSLHTDEILSAVLSTQSGLRTARRLSHVFAMNIPSYHKTLFITDAAVNIAPDLTSKADICRNAIDLLHLLGIERPKLAILSAIETVTSKIPSTLEAAALVVMSHRRQIEGGLLDGPLAFDNAISAEAARVKGIVSEVAGDPDVMVVPNLESGNVLAKQLTYLSGAQIAGVVLGARVPIVLTSRSDPAISRIVSCVICVIMANAQQKRIAQILAQKNQ